MRIIFKAIFVLFLLMLSTIAYFAYDRRNAPIQFTPYPYHLDYQLTQDLSEYENAHILILGGKLGQTFSRYQAQLATRLSKGIKTPLKIANWSGEGESAHRSLFKLRQLKKFPPVIIYVAPSEGFFEKKFYLNEFKKIFFNFKIVANPNISSLIMAVPFLSKFLFRQVKLQQLSETILPQNLDEIPNQGIQTFHQIHFLLLEKELEEISALVREKESNLIFITAPVNLDIAPKKICESTTSNTLFNYLQEIKSSIKDGVYKENYNKLQELKSITVAHPEVYYLLGTAAREIGRMEEARSNLILAQAYDCQIDRPNPVINAIEKKVAARYGHTLLDFDLQVSGHYGKDVTFLNELTPQDVYYQRLMDNLYSSLKKILKI